MNGSHVVVKVKSTVPPDYNGPDNHILETGYKLPEYTSLPLSSISNRISNIGRSNNTSQYRQLNAILQDIESPVEKYQLIKLIVPKLGRGELINKKYIIKCLQGYIGVTNLKDGYFVNLISAINVGKLSERPSHKFVDSIIDVLIQYWNECIDCKRDKFYSLEEKYKSCNNQTTILKISEILDSLYSIKNGNFENKKSQMESVVFAVFDIMYLIKYKTNFDQSGSINSIKIIINALLNVSTINQNVILNSLCLKPVKLSSSIFKATLSLWDVIFSIYYFQTFEKVKWIKLMKLNDSFKTLRNKQLDLIVEIQLGIPFNIMRCCKIVKTKDIVNRIASQSAGGKNGADSGFCIEEKLDGERIIMHLWRDKNNRDLIRLKFFSRNGRFQKWYGSYVGDDKGILSIFLNNDMFENVDNLIFDGEIITYDENKNKLLGFQYVKLCSELISNILHKGTEDVTNLKIYNKFMVYDMVYLNNESLQLTSLKERKDKLAELFQKIDCKFLKLHDWEIGYNETSIKNAMVKVEDRQSEGLVLKKWDSFYELGKISNYWVKLKPFYIQNIITELDVLIMGKTKINYICGLVNDSFENDETNINKFISFCKIRKDFNSFLLDKIDNKTFGYWNKYNKGGDDILLQNNLVFGNLKPDYWIKPEDSVIVTINSKSIVNLQHENHEFKFQTRLKHPAFSYIREDKKINECDRVSDFEMMISSKKFNLLDKMKINECTNSSNETSDDTDSDLQHKKVRKRRKKMTKTEQILNGKKKILDNVVIRDIFRKMKICVLTKCRYNGEMLPITGIENVLKKYGGSIASIPEVSGDAALMLVGEIETNNVSKYLQYGYSIYSFKWCEDSIRSGKLVKIDKSHIFASNNAMVKSISERNTLECGLNSSVVYSFDRLWENIKEKGTENETEIPEDVCRDFQFVLYPNKYKVIGYEDAGDIGSKCHQAWLELHIVTHGGEIVGTEQEADCVVVNESSCSVSLCEASACKKRSESYVLKQIVHGKLVKRRREEQ